MLCGDSPPTGLVGIAKLAAESEVRKAKRAVQYFEIGCRSVLNRTRPAMPFQWSINPYRGCEFGCRYCYARYTHEFLAPKAPSAQREGAVGTVPGTGTGLGGVPRPEPVDFHDPEVFERVIFLKQNAAWLLEQELKRI